MTALPNWRDIPGWCEFDGLYRAQVERVEDGAHIVEIGTFMGRSAALMATLIQQSQKQITFDTIDSWSIRPDEAGATMWRVLTAEMSRLKAKQISDIAKWNLKPFAQYVNLITADSFEAARQYAPASLDFIFLDDNHRAEHVARELPLWWDKLKPGGTIAGHDYGQAYHPGVKIAVDAWADRIGYRVHASEDFCWAMTKADTEKTAPVMTDRPRVEYPAWRYHATEPAKIIADQEEDAALGPGWFNHPPTEDDLVRTTAAVPSEPSEPVKRRRGRPRKVAQPTSTT